MRYRVTSAPTWCGDEDRSYVFAIGDLVEVDSTSADTDGDVYAENLTQPGQTPNGPRHVALSCLTPVHEAGQMTVKVTPDLSDFAAALVEQIAASLEEAAAAIRKAQQ